MSLRITTEKAHACAPSLASRAQAQAFVSNAGGVAVVNSANRARTSRIRMHRSCMHCLCLRRILTIRYRRFSEAFTRQARKVRRDVFGQRPLSGNPARSGYVSRRRCRHGKRRKNGSQLWRDRAVLPYTDIAAVAASETAMTAVAASETAMAAVVSNATALNAVVTSRVALNARLPQARLRWRRSSATQRRSITWLQPLRLR